MHKLRHIELKDSGIIVFGARAGNGLTPFLLELANQLAKTKNVLYVSYTMYKEQILDYLIKQGKSLSPQLTIDTTLEFYHKDLGDEISELVYRTSTNTIIIDGLHDLFGNRPEKEISCKKQFLAELEHLAKMNKLQIILRTTATDIDESNHWNVPGIRNFTWSRNLIDAAEQIFAIRRPAYYDELIDDDGNSTLGKFEIHLIKSRDCKRAYYEIFY